MRSAASAAAARSHGAVGLPALRRPLAVVGVVGCLLLGCLLLGCGPAGAVTATCIEASRYGALARISDGDIARLMALIGRGESERPPSGACRAILLSGDVAAGSTRTLLGAIDENRGWLASVYLALNDGDVEEELMMAAAIRGLSLDTVLLQGKGRYVLDFVDVTAKFPPSVSNGWPDPATEQPTPLALSVRDYLANVDLALPVDNVRCDYACWTLLAAGVERRAIGHVPDSADGGGSQTGSDTQVRSAARQTYGFDQPLRLTASGVVAAAPFLMQPQYTLDYTVAACRTEIDYANGLRATFQKAIDAQASRDFPLMPLAQLSQQMHRIHDSLRGLKQCSAGVMERARRQAYAKLCGTACKLDDMLAGLRMIVTNGNGSGTEPGRPAQ